MFSLIELGTDGITYWGRFSTAHASRVCGYFTRSYNVGLLSCMYVIDSDGNWTRFDDFCREVKANETLLQA